MSLNRYQAFGTHLAGSVGVAALSAFLVFMVWYPAPLASVAGVVQIFLLLLAVDVVIGPVITLLVFNPKKKELKRDLLVVLLLQLSALAYGLHSVYIARPAYFVFSADRFDVVFANDLTSEKLAKVKDARYSSPPHWGPEFAAARRPDDASVRTDIMLRALEGGDDVAQLPEFYEPLVNQKELIRKRLLPLEKLKELNPHNLAGAEAVIRKHGARAGGVGFLPVRGKTQDATAIVASDTAEVLEVVDLKPWA